MNSDHWFNEISKESPFFSIVFGVALTGLVTLIALGAWERNIEIPGYMVLIISVSLGLSAVSFAAGVNGFIIRVTEIKERIISI